MKNNNDESLLNKPTSGTSNHSPMQFFKPSNNNEIPYVYNETKIVALPRDVQWIYVYWSVSSDKSEEIKSKFGPGIFDKARTILRVHDVTGVEFNGFNANSSFDVLAEFEAKNWYIKIENGMRKSFCVDIGLMTKDGLFVLIARSNIIFMPSGNVSDVLDEEWMIIEEDFEKILKLSGGKNNFGMSSKSILSAIIERHEQLKNISSAKGSGGISSFGMKQEDKFKGFWLVADAELIVYGATEADAKVTVQEKEIKLRPDGSFTLRFALPDGTQNIPIKATSKDGDDTREITITVNRNTK